MLSDAQYLDSSPSVDGEEIKKLLDSQLEREKLDGMKHLIALISLGHDAADFFPNVVKNVIAGSVELKRLIYMFLVHYAEDKQEEALLSINSFQKDLSDPNQLIRALALRVMSSIRQENTVELVMLSIRKCAADASAYVRKTAAHAIPKLYSMDRGQQAALTKVTMDLVRDPSILVVGSAVHAFEEVCPHRMDLIHGVYRKLCVVLPEMDEWGQVTIINLLTRYARTQFMDPGVAASDRTGSRASEREESSDSGSSDEDGGRIASDHRLLLHATVPLLQSRNSAVVVAVASLHYHLAPDRELGHSGVAKALVRCSRVGREHAYVVLTSIRSIAAARPRLFRAQLKEFFVVASDPPAVASLKLDIVSSIACKENIKAILAEFRQYVQSGKPELMIRTVQAIGRCAVQLDEVETTKRCLRGLVAFLAPTSRPEIVAESVMVVRNLVLIHQRQSGSSDGAASGATRRAVRAAVRLLDVDAADSARPAAWPAARASVVWMVGEYVDWLPNAAPDVLRQLTRSFVGEAPEVKLQTLTLAAKMCARGVARCGSISAYLFDLADCDLACDVRDRARALRALVGSAFAAEDIDGPVQQSLPLASRILVATAPRPAPILTHVPTTPAFTLGSLSYTVQHRVAGYLPLPEFATTRSDPTVRTPDQSFANFSTEFAAKSVSASSAKDRVAPEVAASVHTSLDQFYTANASESSSDSEDDTSSSSGGYGSSGCSSNGSSSSLSSSYSSSSSAGAGYAV
jgi:AP-3 complex subunit beta